MNFLKSKSGVVIDEATGVVSGIASKLLPKVQRVELRTEDTASEFLSADWCDEAVCAICDCVLLVESDCDWFLCNDCNVYDHQLYGIAFSTSDGDSPGVNGAPIDKREKLRTRKVLAFHDKNDNDTDKNPSVDDVDRSHNVSDVDNSIRNHTTTSNKKRKIIASPSSRSNCAENAKTTYVDGDFVELWMRKHLLPSLDDAKMTNCVIVFDLASVHLRIAGGKSLAEIVRTKASAIAYLRARGEVVDESLYKREITDLVRRKVRREKTQLQVLADANHHRVVYLPAHHPSLNPIEYVWSIVKRRLAREYCRARSFELVCRQTADILANFERDMLLKFVGKVKKEEHHYVQLEVQILQREDRQMLRQWRHLRQASNGAANDQIGAQSSSTDLVIEPVPVPTVPNVMPLSFRGGLNRYK